MQERRSRVKGEPIRVIVPKTIEIGGFNFDIVTGGDTARELQAKQVYGDSSSFLKRIRVDNQMSEQQVMNDFIHEVIHCVNDVYGGGGSPLKEHQVSLLANGLHQILKHLGITLVFDRETPHQGGE